MPARNPRRLHLNAFLHAPGHHEAAWRHPDSGGHRALDVDYHIDLARTAERGLFDAVFLADSLAVRARPDAAVAAGLEPLTLLTALATATEHIGLIATASTTFYEPYILARTLASLDHISHGRAGWNVATGGDLAEAANFNLDEPIEHAVRYERAAEFLDVATQLWDSWADDAVVHDRRAGRYADPDRIREVEHTGLFFKVRGPLNVQRTPQGWPLLVHTASSADGQEFAARYAEVVLTAQQNLGDAAAFAHEVKSRAAAYGREADVPVIMPGIAPVIGSTEAEARRLARELTELQLAEPGVSQLSDLLDVDVSGLDPNRPIPAGLLPREEKLTDHRFAALGRPYPDHRPGDPRAADRPPDRRAPQRRTRPPHRGRHAGADRRLDAGVVAGRSRRRLHHRTADPAGRAGDVRRPGRAGTPTTRPVPNRIRPRHPAGALRRGTPGGPLPRAAPRPRGVLHCHRWPESEFQSEPESNNQRFANHQAFRRHLRLRVLITAGRTRPRRGGRAVGGSAAPAFQARWCGSSRPPVTRGSFTPGGVWSRLGPGIQPLIFRPPLTGFCDERR